MPYTPEDITWFGSEPDRNPSNVKWYGVTDISLTYAVAGTSPEQALSGLDERLKETEGEGLFFPLIHEHDPDTQAALRQKYGERLAVMVIPFSIVEYPEEGAILTDEQKRAFDALRKTAESDD